MIELPLTIQAEIQRVVRIIPSGSGERVYRDLTKDWNLDYFDYAVERVEFDSPANFKAQIRALLKTIREERRQEGLVIQLERKESASMSARERNTALTDSTAIAALRVQKQRGEAMLARLPVEAPELEIWTSSTRDVLSRIYGEDHLHINTFYGDTPNPFDYSPTEQEERATSERLLRHRVKVLEHLLDNFPSVGSQHNLWDAVTPRSDSEIKQASNGKSVFVVHGHDTANLKQLALILRQRYDLDPIVLSEQPGKGQTIIEKFEAEAKRADFAFVLITPDDVIHRADKQYAQARPNVVFELGWFYGRLGRKKVCILCKEGAEIHSDLHGISRIDFTRFINEKLNEIERELVSGEMLTAEKVKSLKDDVLIKYDNQRIISKEDGKKQYFVRDGKVHYLDLEAAKVFDDEKIFPNPNPVDLSEIELLLKERGADLDESLTYKLLGISDRTTSRAVSPIQFETSLSKPNIEAIIQLLVRANAPLTEKELADRAPPHDITSTTSWCNEGVRLGFLARSQGTDLVRIFLTDPGRKYAKSRFLE